MAIKVTNGFEVKAKQPIDTRILLTKEEMLALNTKVVPDNYFCICKDDGKLYIFNAAFESSETLGKFKSYEDVMDIAEAINKAVESPTTKTAIEEAVSKTIPGALEETMSTSEGAQKIADAMFDSEQFSANVDNKISIALDVIQAIGNVE